MIQQNPMHHKEIDIQREPTGFAAFNPLVAGSRPTRYCLVDTVLSTSRDFESLEIPAFYRRLVDNRRRQAVHRQAAPITSLCRRFLGGWRL